MQGDVGCFEEATVLERGTRLLAGAMVVACMLLVGPSVPGGALFARSLPADAARDVVPNRVMTWNLDYLKRLYGLVHHVGYGPVLRSGVAAVGRRGVREASARRSSRRRR